MVREGGHRREVQVDSPSLRGESYHHTHHKEFEPSWVALPPGCLNVFDALAVGEARGK